MGIKLCWVWGTITQPEQAADSLAAGARFLVSPHTEKALAQAMVQTGLPCMMGALTPSEVMMAYQLGADVVKLFPGSLGGPGIFEKFAWAFPGYSADADRRCEFGKP